MEGVYSARQRDEQPNSLSQADADLSVGSWTSGELSAEPQGAPARTLKEVNFQIMHEADPSASAALGFGV